LEHRWTGQIVLSKIWEHLTVTRSAMSNDQIISNISALPVDDQIRIVQAVWDQMPQAAGTTLTPQQHAELDRRMEQHKQNPDDVLTVDELRQKLKDARK